MKILFWICCTFVLKICEIDGWWLPQQLYTKFNGFRYFSGLYTDYIGQYMSYFNKYGWKHFHVYTLV